MALPNNLILNSRIHVTKIDNYSLYWLSILGIKKEQIITGDIFAKKLIIPRQGRCGNPYLEQIYWIRNIVMCTIPKIIPEKEYLILIKRNDNRKIENNNELISFLENISSKLDLKLYLHDDTNLPDINIQHQLFYRAKYVFGPHGGGGVNIISMRHNSWFIEFLNASDINLCYSRLSYYLNINYLALTTENNTINIDYLKEILQSNNIY